jgi:hypothetical protein
MLLFCPRGHDQTGLPAMGGLCKICIETYPDEFACHDASCPDAVKEQHFHPDERSYFIDIDGNKIS